MPRTMQPPPEIASLMAELYAGIQNASNDREAERAKADPQAHKLSRVIEGGASYRYYSGGKNKRGQRVDFCWSCHRNVAGYFLGWREVTGKKQVKRDQWAARRVKRKVQELAQRRAERCRGGDQKAGEE